MLRLRCVLFVAFVAGCSRGGYVFPSPAPLAESFGISTHLLIGSSPQDASSRNFELVTERDAGVKLLRRDFIWGDIEPSKGNFVFDDYDAMVNDGLGYGAEFIGILTYAPAWAQTITGSDSSIVPEDFARFVSETVSHFSGRVRRWEVWNEPNLPSFWRPEPDPAAYGALLKAAYTAAKAADPSCTVAFGGINSEPFIYGKTWGFLAKVYEAHPDIGRYYDVMAFHPYTLVQSSSPEEENRQGNIVRMIQSLKAIMAAHGDGRKPLWITELGWPAGPGPLFYTYPPNITYREQASWMVRSFLLASSQGVEALCWYTFIDGDGSAQPSSENYFGLVRYDRTSKDSFQAYATMARLLGPLHFSHDLRGELGLKADEYGLLFRSSSGEESVIVLWKAGKGMTATVEMTVSTPAREVDLLGYELMMLLPRGKVSVVISNDPVYIVR